jgi:hypothetical protein
MESQYISLGAMLLTSLGATWGLAIWIARQFSNAHSLVYTEVEKIRTEQANKLSYHERHDDNRFAEIRNLIAEIRNSIWEIRLRMASKDGILTLEERKSLHEARPE